VRDPIQRLFSEYCFSRNFVHKWFNISFPATCDGINAWTSFAIEQYAEHNGAAFDCHLLPQWRYVKNAETVLRFVDLGASAATSSAWTKLKDMFGLPSNLSLAVHNAASENPAAAACAAALRTPGCMTAENIAKWRNHFRDDYIHLSKCFTPSTSTDIGELFSCIS
jgi:hypothetical protein